MKGVDLSAWQNVGQADWFDPDFVIAKATEGYGYVDPNCDAHYQHAKAQGKCLGVYHFARPDYNAATTEADWFVDNIQGYIGEAILVLDWEVNTWDVAWAKTFLDRVYNRTGVRPLIYMSASVVNSYDWSSVVNGGYGLWIAGYPAEFNVPNPRTPSTDEMPFGIGAWPFWAIWQYSSSAGSLDRDVACMDAAAWKRYAKSDFSTTKTETPKQEEKPKEETKPKEEEVNKPVENPVEKSEVAGTGTEPKNAITADVISDSTDKGLSKEKWQEIIKKTGQTVELADEVSKKFGFKLQMSNKIYDFLKAVALVVLPLIAMVYVGLAKIWGWGFGNEVDQTVQLGVSIINFILGITVVKASKDYSAE